VAVVLDGSASMAAVDAGGGASRTRAAAEALSARLPLLRERSDAAFFRVGGGLERAEDFAAAPRGLSSDFSSLAKIPAMVLGLKALFLVTDGRRGGPDPGPSLAAAGVPVFTVGVGDPSAAPDLAVEDVRVPPFGFKNVDAEATVRLSLRALPPGGTELRVLSARGEILGRRAVRWDKEEVLEATVSFRPSRAGLETFRVQAAPVAGETNLKNNAYSFPWEVDRDRRRVLYICGRPGPNYAFLRHQLKSDPTLELVTFVILRDPEDVLSAPERELSLIPFPDQDRLLEGLPDFDAVIFEDFSFIRFGLGRAGMDALHRFIMNGGGFLLMTDGTGLGAGSPYNGSPLEDVLPVRLDAPLVPGPGVFRAVPWRPGQPLTELETGAGSAGWDALPPLDGPGVFQSSLRPGATPVLAARGEDGLLPCAAVMAAGKGRTMVMGSLSTWRWALGGAGGAYARFWAGVLSWLTGEDDFKRVRLEPPSGGVAPGEEVLVRVRVRDESHRPVSDASVRLEVRESSGSVHEEVAAAAGDGEYVASFTPRAPGAVFLSARAVRDGVMIGEDRGFAASGAAWDEARDVSPDFPFLKDLSRATGGRFTTIDGFTAAWVSRALDEVSWETRRRTAPRDSPWIPVVLLTVLLVEWVFRRRRGLP
jgi:hypothetical protein